MSIAVRSIRIESIGRQATNQALKHLLLFYPAISRSRFSIDFGRTRRSFQTGFQGFT